MKAKTKGDGMQIKEQDHIPEIVHILDQVVNHTQGALIIANDNKEIVYINEIAYELYNLPRENIKNIALEELLIKIFDNQLRSQEMVKQLKKREKIEFVTHVKDKNQKHIYIANTFQYIEIEEGSKHYVLFAKDISYNKKDATKFYRENYFDYLTKFPNAKLFLRRIHEQLRKIPQEKKGFAVILIDIHRTGTINTTYGINAGDRIIQEVGKRIGFVLTNSQEIFKYHGDVFGIICESITSKQEIVDLLWKINETMKEPIPIHNHYMYVEYRAGIAIGKEFIKVKDIMNRVKLALVKAKKEASLLPYVFYSNEIQMEEQYIMELESDMRIAYENDEFIVYYQPFVSLQTQKIVGMEALLRRIKHNGELVLPGEFINVLEEMNLIGKVGVRVIEKVCMQIKEWEQKGYQLVPVSVNLSAIQFQNINLAKEIKQILKKYEISPKWIVLEITETTVMEDVGTAKVIIDELREAGFCIAIDDFGTGYASIGYLKQLLFDHLKIDISFIKEIVKNPKDRSIVQAIITIAKALNLSTVAEGIENKEQLEVVTELGCEMGQGYLWEKPICAKLIEEKYFR